MDAAETIREAVERVARLRAVAIESPKIQSATSEVKKFQAQRFAGTYTDLLVSNEYSAATNFFLKELYSDSDYTARDTQFARIAGALQTFFPSQVVSTAVALAKLHLLTEELDHEMANAWLTVGNGAATDGPLASKYLQAWRVVGRYADRKQQLAAVLGLGAEIDRLTKTRGLRTMLKMMRRPARAAGLGSLQAFLEAGFDTFSQMSANRNRALEFLEIIRSRESRWIETLSFEDRQTCEDALRKCIASTK
jgi:hypothetical protein